MCIRDRRRALARPGRKPGAALPLAAAALALAVSLWPWEHGGIMPWDSGSRMSFYLVVAGTGLALFLAGAYRRLSFLDAPLARAWDRLAGLGRWRFILLLFGFTLILTNLISLFVFEHLPHLQDSIAQLFQARIFASGRLLLESPRFPGFFDYEHIINDGRWYSQYPFLHSLLMTPFVLAGVPWLLNPLLGALTVPAIYLLGRELYGERTGRFAGLLAALTPFIFNMSAEYMNHAAALLFATLFVLFFLRTLRGGGRHLPLLAGACIGLVANVRPLTALAVAAPFAGYGLYRLARAHRLLPRLLLVAAAGAAVASLLLVYNRLTNGDWLTFGYVVKWGPGHGLGFGRSGWGEPHTPLLGLIHTGNNLNLINKFLYEWPLAALAPVLLPFAAGTRRRGDWLMLAWFLSLLATHFFYWFHSAHFGPRFLYESAPALILLTVRGVEELGPLLRRTFGLSVTDRSAARFAGRAWVLLTAVALLVGLPSQLRIYHRYAGVDGRTLRAVRRAGLGNALVFLNRLGHGFNANDLDLAGDVVYAKDHGILNPALTLAYPDRQYWYAGYDTLRPLGDIRYRGSRLKAALEEMAGFVAEHGFHRYAAVIRPFAEIPTGIEGLDNTPRLTTYRELSRRVFRGAAFEDHLPALACWVIGDRRERLRVFAFMDDLDSFTAGGVRFTLLHVTADGTGAVYDIRPAPGR